MKRETARIWLVKASLAEVFLVSSIVVEALDYKAEGRGFEVR
jgi:hypothetical protein